MVREFENIDDWKMETESARLVCTTVSTTIPKNVCYKSYLKRLQMASALAPELAIVLGEKQNQILFGLAH